MRVASTLAAATLSVLALGCGPSTALLEISSVAGVRIASLSADVVIDGAPTVSGHQLDSTNGVVDLPGSMIIWLPDQQARVDVLLVGTTTDGGPIRASVAFDSQPHQQVVQAVTLGSSQVGGGPVGGDLGPSADQDGGAPTGGANPDLSSGPDASLPSPPDLAPPPVVTLARDTFQRPNQPLWGVASDGQPWGADANASTNFSIVNHTGEISDVAKNNDTGILGPVAANSELLVTASLDSFTGASEIGPTLRFTDNGNFYKAIINGAILKIVLKVGGTSTDLVSASYPATAGTLYSIRFRALGPTLSAKVWPAAAAEPAGWMVTATDPTFSSGYCGVRLVFNASAQATFTSFAAFPL